MGIFSRKKKAPESEPAKKPQRPIVVKNYVSAQTNRLTSGWTTTPASIDDILEANLKTLRARSREQYANNDYMSRFVGLMVSNVVGPKGIQFQARARQDNGDLDKADNDSIEKAFAEWGRKGNCEVTEQNSFKDIQRLFMSSIAIDGEFLAREMQDGLHGYRLQLIDPEVLSPDHKRDLRNGNKIRFSIEFNKVWKPVAYYIRNDSGSHTWQGRKYARVPAVKIIHCFIPERINQKRGIPPASTAMMRLNMLGGYEDAAITAARIGASKMGFFTSQNGAEYVGDDVDADGNIISDAEAGVFEQLPDGMDFKSFNPDYPHQQFPEFVKSCLRGISSGLGVAYNSLSNDLEGVSFSSIRSGVLEDREAWKAIQEWMVDNFMRRVYLNWLRAALFNRVIVGPGGAPLPSVKFDKFSAHSFQGRRWDWVDPLKDTQANVLAVQNGFKSRSQVIRDQGNDPSEVWDELRKENEQLEGLLVSENLQLPEGAENGEG